MKELAIALRFLPEVDSAPKVLATGEGILAERIIRIAEKNGVEIIQDPALACTLSQVPLGSEIPESLYKAVAVLFQFLWQKDSKKKSKPG